MTYTYSDLHFYEWMFNELKKQPQADPSAVEKKILYIKRQIRERNRAESSKYRPVMVLDDGDYCIVKLQLPEDIQTEKEAREYFREYEYIEYRPTYYDCSGQAFTSWYKIFRKPDGAFWAYHAISIDC